MGMTEFLSRQKRAVVILVGLALLSGIATVHSFASLRLLEFSVLYLIPVSFFTWFAGGQWGMLVAFGSAAWVLRMNLRSDEMFPTVAYWNALILLALYVGSVVILGELRTLYLREREISRMDSLTRLPNRRSFLNLRKSKPAGRGDTSIRSPWCISTWMSSSQ